MSGDEFGLDKKKRLDAKREAEEQQPAPQLEPEFPFDVVAFDPVFFGLDILHE